MGRKVTLLVELTILFSLFLLVLPMKQVVAEGSIVVDGDSADWEDLGLAPMGTDPPYNKQSYHDICADLLEAWVYTSTENLYLMIKVRGGYPDDWNTNAFDIYLDIDRNSATGDPVGSDYLVRGFASTGSFYEWNTSTLEWDYKKQIPVAAGGLGYVEWVVSLEDVGFEGEIHIDFTTWDKTYLQQVNVIHLFDVMIPEFQSLIILPLLMMITLLVTIIFRRRTYQEHSFK